MGNEYDLNVKINICIRCKYDINHTENHKHSHNALDLAEFTEA